MSEGGISNLAGITPEVHNGPHNCPRRQALWLKDDRLGGFCSLSPRTCFTWVSPATFISPVLSRSAGYSSSLRIRAPNQLSSLLAAIIVFVRPRDAVARLGALMLAGMASFTMWYGLGKPLGIVAAVRSLPVAAGAFLLVAPTLATLVPSILITFMGVFPRTTISRRWRW